MTLLPVLALAVLWLVVSRSGQGKRLLRVAAGVQGAKLVSIALAIAALVVLMRGGIWEALCLFGFSVYLLNRQGSGAPPPDASLSRVRSAFVELVHDGRTGRLWGTVLAGPLRGAPLDVLTRDQCLGLYRACQTQDTAGAAYLQPYLDRRFPGWGAAMNGDNDPRPGRARFTSRMSEEEANQVLGLRHGAPRDEIVRAHRAAMKKWHPDQGGSADLAARANEAKEVLLRRHP